MEIDIVPLLVAVLGAGGAGAFFREIASGISKVLGGVSARESKRKVDIVQQRDEAIARETRAWKLVDAEAEKRRRIHEYASALKRQLIEAGLTPSDEPEFEQTITKAQLKRLREQESP